MGLRASKLSVAFDINRRGRHHRDGARLAPKGYVPVYVGIGDDSKRFMIQTTSLGDADLLELLCKSAEEYGFRNSGVLKIPCDAKSFEERMLAKAGHRTLKVKTA